MTGNFHPAGQDKITGAENEERKHCTGESRKKGGLFNSTAGKRKGTGKKKAADQTTKEVRRCFSSPENICRGEKKKMALMRGSRHLVIESRRRVISTGESHCPRPNPLLSV